MVAVCVNAGAAVAWLAAVAVGTAVDRPMSDMQPASRAASERRRSFSPGDLPTPSRTAIADYDRDDECSQKGASYERRPPSPQRRIHGLAERRRPTVALRPVQRARGLPAAAAGAAAVAVADDAPPALDPDDPPPRWPAAVADDPLLPLPDPAPCVPGYAPDAVGERADAVRRHSRGAGSGALLVAGRGLRGDGRQVVDVRLTGDEGRLVAGLDVQVASGPRPGPPAGAFGPGRTPASTRLTGSGEYPIGPICLLPLADRVVLEVGDRLALAARLTRIVRRDSGTTGRFDHVDVRRQRVGPRIGVGVHVGQRLEQVVRASSGPC